MGDMDETTADQVEETDAPARKTCMLCEKASALIGCAVGIILFAIGIDLLTKGGLSKRVNRTDIGFDSDGTEGD